MSVISYVPCSPFATAGALTDNGLITLSPASLLTVHGAFNEGSTGKLNLQLGAVAGADSIGSVVSTLGTVSLAGTLAMMASAAPPVGDVFDILDNEGDAAIRGHFKNIGTDFTVKAGSVTMVFQISYAGTDSDGSNNVVITQIS